MLVSDIIIAMTKRKKEIAMSIEKKTHKNLKGEGEGVVFVSTLRFIIQDNLFGRETYWYCWHTWSNSLLRDRIKVKKKGNNRRLSKFHEPR